MTLARRLIRGAVALAFMLLAFGLVLAGMLALWAFVSGPTQFHAPRRPSAPFITTVERINPSAGTVDLQLEPNSAFLSADMHLVLPSGQSAYPCDSQGGCFLGGGLARNQVDLDIISQGSNRTITYVLRCFDIHR